MIPSPDPDTVAQARAALPGLNTKQIFVFRIIAGVWNHIGCDDDATITLLDEWQPEHTPGMYARFLDHVKNNPKFHGVTLADLEPLREEPPATKKQATVLPIEQPDELSLGLTDAGNADRLIERHGADLRYVEEWKKWLAWDGRRWNCEMQSEVARRALCVVRDMRNDARYRESAAERRKFTTHAKACESASRLEAMVKIARYDARVTIGAGQLDRQPWLFNVLNGTIDLQTGKLLPHSPNHLITKLAPVTFDPEATAPTWDQFLSDILGGDEALIAFVRRAFGYALIGAVLEHCLFCLYGTGSNGKSTLLKVLVELYAEYGAQVDSSIFLASKFDHNPNVLVPLAGSRLVSTSETDSGRRLAESTVKTMTGGDIIRAKRLYEESFAFIPSHTIFLATNHKPNIRGADEGIWRRIKLIPFAITIPDELQDKNLPSKLATERSGILNWLIAGCLEYQQIGLKAPAAVTEATRRYREDSDILGDYLAAHCETGEGLEESAKALLDRYAEWCQAEGCDPISKEAFGRALTERGFGSRKGAKGSRIRTGIALRSMFSEVALPDSEPATLPI